VTSSKANTYNSNYENNQQDVLYRLIYYSKSALHVSGDVFAHHQEHLTVFTVSGGVHPSCCLLPAGRNSGLGKTSSLTLQKFDVHESVHRDTTTKITNKMHYID
jgi:hypothetical protein